MNIPLPASNKFTVYTKSGCKYCEKVKDALEHSFETPEIIPCDDFLVNDFLVNSVKKQEFVAFMNSLTKDKFKTFPVVFFDKTFIGGYNETVLYLQK